MSALLLVVRHATPLTSKSFRERIEFGIKRVFLFVCMVCVFISCSYRVKCAKGLPKGYTFAVKVLTISTRTSTGVAERFGRRMVSTL